MTMRRTLFDFIRDRTKPKPVPEAKQNRRPASCPTNTRSKSDQRYEHMTRTMLAEYGIRVRKWRSSTSGVAWQLQARDGTISRLIESPKPRGPVSADVFLHEIGHHAIGFNRYKPRCLEEYHAWMFSLEQMQRWDITITDRVQKRVHDSLRYAVDKAIRRGLKRLPEELAPYTNLKNSEILHQ